MKKNNIILYICIAVFLIIGIYLTFFAGSTSGYDSQTKAYKIEPNENYDGESTTYRPIYYYKVAGREYECKTKSGSSAYPNEKKNIVYYNENNPEDCKTQYEKSSSKVGGILVLVFTAIMIAIAFRKPTTSAYDTTDYSEEPDGKIPEELEENAEKVANLIGKIQLIYKRVILGIVIIVLLIFVLIDTTLLKQTIKSRGYIEATATFVERTSSDSPFDDCIYTFTDKSGNQHEIVESITSGSVEEETIKIRYNENNPEEYYEETAILNKSGFIWYIVKVVALVLLALLFFNKKLLSKVSISAGGSHVNYS